MKKKVWNFVFLILIVVIPLIYYSFPYIFSAFFSEEKKLLLEESTSPNGNYTISAYQVNGGATVDFAVEVYLNGNKSKRKLIYDAYHESEVTIVWLDDKIVSINGKSLDLSKDQVYDWRKGVVTSSFNFIQ